MSPTPTNFAAMLRSAVFVGGALAALAVPGLPDPVRAAVATLLTAIAAAGLALAGRGRLANVEARFQPPDPALLLRRRDATASQAMPQQATLASATPAAFSPQTTGSTAFPPVAGAWAAQPGATAVVAGHLAGEPVYLGPAADPSFPSWQLHWQLPDGRTGVVPLPLGERITLGRQPDCHVVAALEEVSRIHLILQVARAGVTVADTGSSNGTWLRQGEGIWTRMTGPQPVAFGAWDQLRIAEPWAIVWTLEPAGRS